MIIPRVRIESISLDEPEVKSALLKNQLVVGPYIEEFEYKLATLFNFNFSITASSGFGSLFLLIKALELERVKIIVPSVSTCFAIANAVLASGNKPVFCDIEPETLNLNIDSVDKLCNINKISLIIAPSHFGIPAKINDLKCFDIPVIEDACQAFHTRIRHKSEADMLILSFYPTKFFNTIEGGAILCNNSDIVDKIKDIRYYEQQTNYDGRPRYNMRMANLNAAIGISQLRKVENQSKQLLSLKMQYSLLRNQLPDHFFIKQFEPDIIPWRLLLKINDHNSIKSIYQAGIEISHELIYCGLDSPHQKISEIVNTIYSLPFYIGLSEEEFYLIKNTVLANV